MYYKHKWAWEVESIIIHQAILDSPISRKKAELINKELLRSGGSNGIICNLTDYLKSYDGAAAIYPKDHLCIAMNIDTFADHIHYRTGAINSSGNLVLNRKDLDIGFYAVHYGIPIIVSEKIKTKIH